MAGLRDNFSEATKRLLASRVAFRCSNPDCRATTIGPAIDPEKIVNLGVAVHICAAAPGGMRYDQSMMPEQRSAASNGLWLCMRCAKLVDSDAQFTVKKLLDWRQISEKATIRENQSGRFTIPADAIPLLEDIDGNSLQVLKMNKPVDVAEIGVRAHAAALADIAAFKLGPSWPDPAVQLALTGKDETGSYEITDLANAIRAGRELSVVAQPGTGKTTTLMQAADSILSTAHETVAFVPLGNWSNDTCALIASVAKRVAFNGVSEQDLLLLALHDRLTLLLDGWNELDQTARARAAGEIERLRREYPLLRIVISTRRQAMDLPISGPIIEVQPLSEEQQTTIARGIAGDNGVKVLDSAWRTPGVRELVSIPLYLTALITKAPDGALPTTKEEVLRLFITGQEKKPAHAAALDAMLFGNHKDILIGLGVEATKTANTAIPEGRARAVVSAVEMRLHADGQLGEQPQPKAVLDVLVNHHVLVRLGGDSIGFQHQQFQEWHASFDVEKTMLQSSAGDYAANKRLTTEIINMPAWEEAVLFACERLSRQGGKEQKTVADAIRETFSIDPMLAADMVYRSSDAVWDSVKAEALAFAGRWHKPGRVDRAVRFMIVTGRADFSEQIWPLLYDKADQRHIVTLRAAPRFRPLVLGRDAEKRLADLPDEIRDDVLGEIASHSGIDGMELAARVAKADPKLDVQMSVISALLFRRGERLISEILANGSPALWKAAASSNAARYFHDAKIAARIRAERWELTRAETDKIRVLGLLVDTADDQGPKNDDATKKAIKELIASGDFPMSDRHAAQSIQKAYERFPELVRSAFLYRLGMGLPLPFRSYDILSGAPIIDEGPIAELVFSAKERDESAAYAASMIGPNTIGQLLNILLGLNAKLAQGAALTESEKLQHFAVRDRLRLTRIAPSVEAWLTRAVKDEPEHIAIMADTLAKFGDTETKDTALPLPDEQRRAVAVVLRRWAAILASDQHARRRHLAELATAIGKLGQRDLLGSLLALLDEDLARRKKSLEEFLSSGGRRDPNHEARVVYGLQYRFAFAALGGAEASKALRAYLSHLEFGPDAANAIKDIYEKANKPKESGQHFGGPDFSAVQERREEIANGARRPDTEAAAAIFDATENLSGPSNADKEHRLALHLARVATLLPHRRRPELTAKLLALPVPWAAKRDYLIALVLAGETVGADMLMLGITEFFELAKKETWRLQDDAWELHSWLELLPFSDRPSVVLDALVLVPPIHKEPRRLQRVMSALAKVPGPDAEHALFEMADHDTRMYGEYDWVTAVLNRETSSAYMKLLELAESNPVVLGRFDGFHFERQLLSFVGRNPNFRAELMRRFTVGDFKKPGEIVERVLAESANAETVVSLVKRHAAQGQTRLGNLRTAIENAVLEHRPIPGWNGAYEIHGIASPELRRELFDLTRGPEAQLASECLNHIDRLRDEHGRMEFEPRHPHIESGLPWPVEARNAGA